MALAAVDAVVVGGHEEAGAALGADLTQALHLARVVHLVELEHAHLDVLVLVLLLLGLGVGLLLALLGTAEQSQHHVQLGVIADAAGGQAGSILKLPALEHQALLVSGDALARLDGGLDIRHRGGGAKLQDLGPICRSN